MVALLLASMATHLPTVRAQPTDDQPEGEEAPQDLQHAPGVFEGHTLLALVCDGDQARAYPLPNGCAGVEEEVDLEAELGEVNYFVHGETRLDFLAWATH